jgi:hypothetical protein
VIFQVREGLWSGAAILPPPHLRLQTSRSGIGQCLTRLRIELDDRYVGAVAAMEGNGRSKRLGQLGRREEGCEFLGCPQSTRARLVSLRVVAPSDDSDGSRYRAEAVNIGINILRPH